MLKFSIDKHHIFNDHEFITSGKCNNINNNNNNYYYYDDNDDDDGGEDFDRIPMIITIIYYDQSNIYTHTFNTYSILNAIRFTFF